ncbi:Multicopper oxidase with three cupredoxin domains (includes cell division protein FtsP and spore coat protein CotA) [Bradyrhizobium yuanmingense]|uniref:Multicopper oxidase with three cupredoxin domains (Includes cell division protein FtsP and spore coat protein CotA) n=1 Tax=Bradyrhizobium yuanmingense TaxID=108015 RepID=A0A1C3WAK9_9BRAD|nr:multicopper oxidase domain-containing protein [Bradyrhizobium yuanmingense]TWI27252.1 FtsP/CotA-like multicopper oxidase with cupredoxin domain [Bradyrhizobium yuanmingense]SCB36858.1 Multicopper oxidase with three cupredoxin domains (includes cell division protein FtsP and spore coat protein CotA) [Bradyrhizobium yuanmingense]
MTTRIHAPHRREVLAGLGASAAGLIVGGAGPSVTAQLALQARPATLALRPGQPATPIWELATVSHLRDVHLKRFDRCQVVFSNNLPVPIAPVWYSLHAPMAADPLRGRAPAAPDATETSIISVPNAGTLLADFRLFEHRLQQPARALPIIVAETGPVAVDRDELLLIQEWRLRPDGTAVPPGQDPKDTTPLYTINGKTSFELSASASERLRLRFINGSQRSVLAIKLENHEVRVMALDGQPAEPFPARNGALVLAPGARADAFVDAASSAPFMLHDGKAVRQVGHLTVSGKLERAPLPPPQPLPPNDLPEKLDLRAALRFDVALGTADAGWARPATFSTASAPAFRAKTGRTVVLALQNPAPVTTVFHLHGHHFRLLDKLDDGWKPYWLDTLAIEPGQTQRIAFAATSPGRWLIESVVTDWAAPRLVRWYGVE